MKGLVNNAQRVNKQAQYFQGFGAALSILRVKNIKVPVTSLRLLCVGLIFWCSTSVSAEAKNTNASRVPTVHFAGVSYLGNYGLLQENYPHTLKLNTFNSSGVGPLDKAFRKFLEGNPSSHYNVDFGLGDMSQGSHLVMTLAIENELLSQESWLAGRERKLKNKLIADVSAQVLIFDFKTMALMANVHVEGAANGAMGDDPLALFRSVYDSHGSSKGLLEIAAQAAATLRLDYKGTRRFQVAKVITGQQIRTEHLQNARLKSFEQHIGQYFTSKLAAKTSVNVLPYTRGYALGNQLPTRFSDGRAFNLTIPKADVEVDVAVQQWNKLVAEEYDEFASMSNIRVHNTLSNTEYFRDDFKRSVKKLKIGSEVTSDEISAFEDSVEQLIEDFTDQLQDPSSSWFKTYSRGKSTSYKNVKAMKKQIF